MSDYGNLMVCREPCTLKWRIFCALDNLVGSDLVTAVNQVRVSFEMTHEEFLPFYDEWQAVTQ